MVKESGSHARNFFIGLIVIVGVLSFFIARPFLDALLTGGVITYVFHPLFLWLNRRIKSRNLCALIISVFIILLLTAPIYFLLQVSVTDLRLSYIHIKQKILTGEIIDIGCIGQSTAVCKFSGLLQNIVNDRETRVYIEDILSRATVFFITKISEFILALPRTLLNIGVTFFIIFYLLKDGDFFIKRIKDVIPLKKSHQEHIFQKLKDTFHAVIYGSILVALIQGALGALGFYFFGFKSALLWGGLIAVFALVPIMGTAIVWGPAGLFLILASTVSGDSLLFWQGIGLLVYGAVVISTIDNILKPKLIGDRAGVHPILVLVGALGGLAFFGIVGFVVGPLILALLNVLLEIHEKERKELNLNGG